MAPRHVHAEPESRYVGTEEVALARLDDVASNWLAAEDHLFLKLDVQGFEPRVLRGAEATLDRALGIEIELSMVPLYEGQALLPDLVATLHEKHFRLVSIEPGFADPSSAELLQADGIFLRGAS